MANGNGFVQRAPLPPLSSPTIAESDRARVYGAIGKEIGNILNGATSYHADSVKKSSKDLMSELNDFIDAVGSLKDAVNDPGNIVGDVVRDLKGFRKAFETGVSNDIETMWNDRKDERDSGIKLPDSLAPTTEDHNIIYVDPEFDGQFSGPNPVSPNQWPKDLKASTRSDDVAASGVTPDVYPRLVRRVSSAARGSINPLNTQEPMQRHRLADHSGYLPAPMPDYALPPSIWDAPAVPFAPSSNPNSMSGLAGRLAALAGIDPENPDRLAPQPGGLLGPFLSGQR